MGMFKQQLVEVQSQLSGLKEIVETQGSSMKFVALTLMRRRMGMF